MLKQWICTTPESPWRKMPPKGRPARTATLALSGTRHQAWEGMGGCFNELGWTALKALSAAARRDVMRELFDPHSGCRFNICRLPIGASDYAAEWYSLNETDGDFQMRRFSIERDRGCLIPYIREALRVQPDLALFASPWSPPTWLKRPKVYNYGTLVWERKYLAAYALYFVKFIEAYRKEGITVHQIHPQNEPAADQKFPSCLWTGARMRDFIRDYLGPAFRRHGLSTEIWLGTINSDDYDGFANTVLSDPRARRFVAGVGYQWAGKGAIQRTSESWPGVRLMQTENECGDGRNTWPYAQYVFDLIRHYVANGAGAYIYWNMVLAPGGRSTWGWQQNAMITVDPEKRTWTRNPEFYVMKHVSRFVEPGAVRVGLQGPLTGNALAFANPMGETVVLVANPLQAARELAFEGPNGTFAVSLPPASINTLIVS